MSAGRTIIGTHVGWRACPSALCRSFASPPGNTRAYEGKGLTMISSNTLGSSVRLWRRSTAALMFCATLVGCGTQVSGQQEEGASSASVDVTQRTQAPARTRVTAASLRAPQLARAFIRPGATAFEVEIQSPQGFSPRAFDPVLRIGDKEFTGYRESAQVGEYGAVFRVERPVFEALADDSVVSVGYGRKFAGPLTLGRLDKRAFAIR